jgi:hypothetical protein
LPTSGTRYADAIDTVLLAAARARMTGWALTPPSPRRRGSKSAGRVLSEEEALEAFESVWAKLRKKKEEE